eukprot:g18904.t1
MSQPQQVLLLSAFKKFDINGDGTISEDGDCNMTGMGMALPNGLPGVPPCTSLMRARAHHREDELKRVMLLLDPSFTPYELDVIFSTADLSKDGSVSIEDRLDFFGLRESEFSHWAAEPQGIFGVVPARAVHAMSREEQAALRIQSLARGANAEIRGNTTQGGRMARKRVKPEKRKKSVERVDEAPVTRIRPKVDLYELVSGFNGCIRTGLSSAAGELLPEQVNHLALLIKTRKELVPDDEAFEELRRIKEIGAGGR